MSNQARLLNGNPGGANVSSDKRPIDLSACLTAHLNIEHHRRHQSPIGPSGFGAIMGANYVQDDVVVAGIKVMAMLAPAAGAEVQFHASVRGWTIVDADNSAAEIWSETVCPRSEMNQVD